MSSEAYRNVQTDIVVVFFHHFKLPFFLLLLSPQNVDITQAVTERIKAQRRLAENPYDISAICMLSRAQEQVEYFSLRILKEMLISQIVIMKIEWLAFKAMLVFFNRWMHGLSPATFLVSLLVLLEPRFSAQRSCLPADHKHG